MTPRVGDYGTVRTSGVPAALIRLGTRSPVNHAFIYAGNGRIVEAQPGGAVWTELHYTNIHWSDHFLTRDQRWSIAKAAHSMLGTRYGWADIAALSFACAGIRSHAIDKRIERTDRLICSQLVDKAYELAGLHLFTDGRLPGEVTPGDLYNLAPK